MVSLAARVPPDTAPRGSAPERRHEAPDEADEACAILLSELSCSAPMLWPLNSANSNKRIGECETKRVRLPSIHELGLDWSDAQWASAVAQRRSSLASSTTASTPPSLSHSRSTSFGSTVFSFSRSPQTPTFSPLDPPRLPAVQPQEATASTQLQGRASNPPSPVTAALMQHRYQRTAGAGHSLSSPSHGPALRRPRDLRMPRSAMPTSMPMTRARQRAAAREEQQRQQRRASISSGDRCNKAYSTEQKDWILYMRVDLRCKWEDMIEPFRRCFPNEPNRGDSGMQSVYYRMNDKEMPALDGDGDAVWDYPGHGVPPGMGVACGGGSGGEAGYLTRSLKVRDGSGKFGLIARFPERVVRNDYMWMLDEHKAEARRRVARRREKHMDAAARMGLLRAVNQTST